MSPCAGIVDRGDAPVARNGTPAGRVPASGAAAPEWPQPWWRPPAADQGRRGPRRRKTLREIAPPTPVDAARPAWWVAGDAPSMGGQALGAGTCTYGAPADEPRRDRPRAQRTRGSEEDLPAQHQETGQEPRVSTPHVHPCREGHPQGTPSQRSPPPLRVRAAGPGGLAYPGPGDLRGAPAPIGQRSRRGQRHRDLRGHPATTACPGWPMRWGSGWAAPSCATGSAVVFGPWWPRSSGSLAPGAYLVAAGPEAVGPPLRGFEGTSDTQR